MFTKSHWVTSAWHQLRPLLNPFYHTLRSPSPTLTSLSLTEWTKLLQPLDEGVITTAMSHPSLNVGVRIFHVGNTNVSSLQQLRQMSFRSRRIWVSISDPQSAWRKLNELKGSSEAWQMLLSSTSLVYSMLPRPTLTCQAAADAMANDTLVGIGGYVVFPSGVSGWYQLKLNAEDFEGIAAWASIPLQHSFVPSSCWGNASCCNWFQRCYVAADSIALQSQLVTIQPVKWQLQNVYQAVWEFQAFCHNSFDISCCTIFSNRYSTFQVIVTTLQMH